MTVSSETVEGFRRTAAEKIRTEGWVGRNTESKALNFVKAWTSEFAWKTLLDQRGVRYEWANTYIGRVEDAPLDFKMWFGGLQKTVGMRSRDIADLSRWGEIPYPDDRVRTGETNRIEDYTIAASIAFESRNSTEVRLYGAIEKERFIQILQGTYRKLSPIQQEYFRPVSLKNFSQEVMLRLLDSADRM